jgi:hypothetical protein
MSSNTALKVGLPMVTFMVGGCYVLSEFMQTHVELKDRRNSTKSTREFDLEEERNAMIDKLKIQEGFTLSRIPRPDEDKAEKPKSLQSLAEQKK